MIFTRLSRSLLGFLLWLIYRCLSRTWRVTLIEPPSLTERRLQKKISLMAHWHGDELPLLRWIGFYNVATLVSTSKDGDLMNFVAQREGAMTSRGSSTRSSVGGTLALLRIMKKFNRSCSMAVDGPKGPIYKAKPGVFEISRALDAPIFAGGAACDRAWHFTKAWNQAVLPKPFSKVVIFWEDTLPPVQKSQDPKEQKNLELLEQKINSARQKALDHLRKTSP
jgi:lysophospholipid acyltransferase (LPLAT)-like uncharacterized protein